MHRLINRQFLRGFQTVFNNSQQKVLSKARPPKYWTRSDALGIELKNYPALRCVATQKYLTPSGTISGGWLMSQMDIAGGVVAWDVTAGPIYTVSCDSLKFHKTVKSGELVSFYANLMESNNSSIKVFIEGKARAPPSQKEIRVTSGTFTYIPVDKKWQS
jgi:acyl-CoA thioesterase YciA